MARQIVLHFTCLLVTTILNSGKFSLFDLISFHFILFYFILFYFILFIYFLLNLETLHKSIETNNKKMKRKRFKKISQLVMHMSHFYDNNSITIRFF